ncbi:Conserved_hypothetical protein [Hexamita inflata]|uniref:Uncharacterized protein n=1 Tax=Hexamita inflata TaxID=28002 RepID=A0ABP1H6S4_9EUKA
MLLIYTSLQASASSFTECYSAKSYINGNSLTYQLNLHLIPFERLVQITEENLCQMYLPGKIVVAQIHYDDLSFPRAGQDEVNFIYKFNQEIIVSFQLDEADYRYIIDKQNAMYELWYDVNLVKVNNSVNTIEHTKYNGTNCFQQIQLEYTIYEDIDINVIANNCEVRIDPALQVYLEFEVGLGKQQVPIFPCSQNCLQDEYSVTSTQFHHISIYRIKKTSYIAAQLASFYTNFIQNRRLRITMNLLFNTNGIDTVITRTFDEILAKDTYNCKVNDTYLALFAIFNSDSVQLQYRDSFKNKLLCDLPGVVSVHVDMYLFDDVNSLRIQKSYGIEKFNENVGASFKNIDESDALRNNHDPEVSKATMVVSYLDASGQIVYDLIVYNDPFYVGCINRAVLHLHKTETCIDYYFNNISKCTSNLVNPNEKNNLGIFYQENNKAYSLGLYKLNRIVDYSLLRQQLCFVCDEFVDDTIYAKPSCKENQSFTKEKLKSMEINFAIISDYEFNIFKTVAAEYQSIYMPFTTTSVLLMILTVVSVMILHKRYNVKCH